MSCVLRVYSPNIESVLDSTALRPYRVEAGTAHFTVSEAGPRDFGMQITDAIEFLSANGEELTKLVGSRPLDATLDFAVAWRHVVVQNDVLPSELIQRAAEFGLGIELSHYPLTKEENVAEA
jgi:hypothetical protein